METAEVSATPFWLPFLVIVVFFIGFPVIWCGVIAILSLVGGWHTLAKHYRAGDRPVTGTRAGSVVGMVGLVSYRHVVTIHFAEEGFFLETMILFRFGHPRLYIPWSEVTERKRMRLIFYTVDRMKIGNPTIATLSFRSTLMDAHLGAPAAPVES